MKNNWVWMGRPAHFIGAAECLFRMATYIPASNVIVSTVGDYRPFKGEGPTDIGYDRKYETFVFKAKKGCCSSPDCGNPYSIVSGLEIDSLSANTGEEANLNHYKMCAKWAKKPPHSGKEE